MRSIPMLMVRNVPKSLSWYRELLGADNDHGRDDFDQIISGSSDLLMLHCVAEDEHGLTVPRDGERLGVGCAIWFSTYNLSDAFARAEKLEAEIVVEPWENPRAGWKEFSIRDPDGYTINLYSSRSLISKGTSALANS